MGLSSLLGVLGVKLQATGLAEFQGDMGKAAAATEAAARRQTSALQHTARELGKLANLGGSVRTLGTAITASLTLPVLAVGAASTKAAITWETAFTGVRKTVAGTKSELDSLGASLRDLSTTQPTSANDLAGIAASAGQLGIARENILGFTKVVADLAVTTNLTAEQGASDLARLANITQLPQTQFSNLGSTVVALGNNFATTESEIVAMALRLAGAGSQIGLTQAETVGLAAALSSVGIEAEAGGSAFSRVMKDMAVAVAKGGKELRDFSAVAARGGVANFVDTFKRAPAEAIAGFIQGLINIRREGGDVIALLERMGITEIRMSDALLRTAGAGDLVARSLQTSATAWRQNTALTREAETRYATTASQLEVLKNKGVDIAVSFGTALLPAIRSAITLLDAIARPLKFAADLFGRLPGPVQLVVVGTGLLLAAIGPLVFAMGALVNTTATATRTLIEFGLVQRAAAAATGTNAAAQGLAGAAGVAGLRAQLGSLLPTLASVTSRFTSFGGAGAAAVSRIGTLLPAVRTAVLAVGVGVGAATLAAGTAAAAAIPVTTALVERGHQLNAEYSTLAHTQLEYEAAVRRAVAETGLFRGALILAGDAARGVASLLGGVISGIGDLIGASARWVANLPVIRQGVDFLAQAAAGASHVIHDIAVEAYSVGEASAHMDQVRRRAEDMAKASKLAGREIKTWDEALQELAKHSKTLEASKGLVPIDPARVKALVAEFGGAGLKSAVAEADAALTKLQASGPLAADALARVAREAEQLKAQGATLSPALTAALEQYKKTLAEIDKIGAGPTGPKDKKGLGSDEQPKQIAAVRAELQKLEAVHKGTYAAALADVDAAIDARIVEAKGIGETIALLERLRTAKKEDAGRDFIRQTLGSFTGDAQQAVRQIEEALLRQAGVADQAILAGAQLTQQILERAQQAGLITQQQLGVAADRMVELRGRGAEIPPVLQDIADTWRTTGGALASGFDVLDAEAKKALETYKLLGPTLGDVTDDFERWQASAAARGGIAGLSEQQLDSYVAKLRELAAAAAAAGGEVPGLTSELSAAAARLADLQAPTTQWAEYLSRLGAGDVSGALQVLAELNERTREGAKQTEDWSARVRDLAAVFEVLGIKADSGLGRVLGGLTAGMSAFQALGKAATAAGTKGFSLGNLFKGADGKVGVGSLIGGLTTGLQAASAAVSIGKAIVRLFGGDPVKKAAKQAGQVLGTDVSRAMAEKILATSKELGVSIQIAALLNLSGVIAESVAKGGDARQFSGQVVQLLELAAKGGKEAARALEEAGKGFTSIAEAAQKAGTVGDASLRRILRSARELNQLTPEMTEFLRTQIEGAATGITAVIGKFEVSGDASSKLVGGLDLFMGAGAGADLARVEENAGALARRFSATFWAVVGQEGVVAAGKALGAPFAALKAQLSAVFPDLEGQLGSLLAPVERLIDLSNNPLFAGASDAVAGLKANLEGLANADQLQAGDLADYGTLALATRDQMLAAGADSKTALQAVQPLLQSLISASQQYGVQLDTNSQALVDQAKADGLVFKTEPIERVALLLESIARKMGAEIPAEAARGAAATAAAWDSAGNAVASSSTTAAAAAAAGFAGIPAAASIASDRTVAVFTAAGAGVADTWTVASGSAISAILQMQPAADSVAGSFDAMGQRATGWLEDLRARLDGLARGVTVPIHLATTGGIPFPEPPEVPPVFQAARGAFVHGRSSGRGAFFEVGEPGAGDEIIAPVKAVLAAGARAAAGGAGGVMDAVLAELVALREENARMRDAPARLGERPVNVNMNARLHADGRAIGDLVGEQLDVGHEKLGRALDRRQAGRRGGR
jgi:TP901 family phage tail tape measure protein